MLGIPFRKHSLEEKTARNSIPKTIQRKRNTQRILFRTLHGKKKMHEIPSRTVHEMPETTGMEATSIRPAQTAGTPTTVVCQKQQARQQQQAGMPTAGNDNKSREDVIADEQDFLENFHLLFCCLLESKLFSSLLSSDLHLAFWFARVLV